MESIQQTNLQVSGTPLRVENFANILRTFREQRAEAKVLKRNKSPIILKFDL